MLKERKLISDANDTECQKKKYVEVRALKILITNPERKGDMMILWAMSLLYHLGPASIHTSVVFRGPVPTSNLM